MTEEVLFTCGPFGVKDFLNGQEVSVKFDSLKDFQQELQNFCIMYVYITIIKYIPNYLFFRLYRQYLKSRLILYVVGFTLIFEFKENFNEKKENFC